MKFYHFVLLAILITYINTDCYGKTGVSKKGDCHDSLSDTEKKTYSHCCYQEDENGNKECVPVTKEYFDSIEKLTQASKEAGIESKGKFDCASSYVNIGLLSLLFAVL